MFHVRTAGRAAVRFCRSTLSRPGAWYLAAAALTSIWLLARILAPAPGLTRSYHLLDRSTPPVVDARAVPIVEERITSLDLAFIEQHRYPTRFYQVRWTGVWWSPRPEHIEFDAAADDGVIVRIDGEVVLERNPRIGMTGAPVGVQLDAGAHHIEIVHWQHGGGRSLDVRWAHAGSQLRPLGPERIYPESPGAIGYGMTVISTSAPMLVLLAWAACFSIPVAKRCAARYRALTAGELRTRVGAVLFPGAPRSKPASRLRSLDGPRHQSVRVPGLVLAAGAVVGLAARSHGRHARGRRGPSAGTVVLTVCRRTLGRRRIALDPGQSAACRLRLADRDRSRPESSMHGGRRWTP